MDLCYIPLDGHGNDAVAALWDLLVRFNILLYFMAVVTDLFIVIAMAIQRLKRKGRESVCGKVSLMKCVIIINKV